MNEEYTDNYFREQAIYLSKKIAKAHKLLNNLHHASLGYVGEELMRSFLKKIFKNQGLSVVQGFIQKENDLSKQCDIIIIDNSIKNAIKYRVGNLFVVSSNSVRAVIEVKTSIQIKTWHTTLDEIKILNAWGIHNFFLFVYGQFSIRTLKTFLYGTSILSNDIVVDVDSKYDHGCEYLLPRCICSLDSNATHTLSYIDGGRDSIGYLSVKAFDNNNQQIASLHEFISEIWQSVYEYNEDSLIPNYAYFKKVNGVILYEL